jgi:hypothetical protein
MGAVEFEPGSTGQAAALFDAVSKRGLAGHLGRLVRRAARRPALRAGLAEPTFRRPASRNALFND